MAKRTRRSPEVARDLILDAADRVFARELPDAVGLREIAAEAKISHGLVTHYFATYDNLVATVLERRLGAARAQAFAKLGQGFDPRKQPLLDALIELLEDKALVRLIAWSALRGDPVFGKAGGLGRLVDVLMAPLIAGGAKPDRTRFELALVFAMSTVMGWGVIGASLANGVGARIDRERLRTELQRMLFAYLGAP
ncbi:MAG TPA: TetR/AcrR family transcriptional regulator [Kofleriaceae bacterium]|jgi:AcrR family transcriptional regulator|nr:TetR/AcrR family transcriptional regulator [Kofleriaceae bacterium]